MKRSILLRTIVGGVAALAASIAGVPGTHNTAAEPKAPARVYDFEDLAFGRLAGQDDWKEIPGTPVLGPGIVGVGTEADVTPPNGPNTTKVLMGTARVSRINNARWGYTVSPKDKAWELQIDYKREGPYISLGFDANGDGTISSDEVVGWIKFGAGLAIHANSKPNGNPDYVYSDGYPNLKGNFEGDAGTWLRAKLIFNWTDQAPGVHGTVTAQVKNLQRKTDWEPVFWPGRKLKLPLTRHTWGKWLANASVHPERAGIILCPHHNRVLYQMDNISIGVAGR